ncbi:uncharacterized protein LOC129880323 [Solanum dulcamara]|uniref:uncharacterized protein LOC129880323 n=1 Tax=Solanum dulcamara TaxID=45834 RepID=UPI002485591E|nr:uncharacterized protein LOC129880323 [Solanum dulcamara]
MEQQNVNNCENRATPFQEINTNKFEEQYMKETETKKTMKKKEPKVRTFHSIPAQAPTPASSSPPPPVVIEKRVDFAKIGGSMASNVMQMQIGGGPRPEFGLVETRPPLAARMGYWDRDKTASTYDLVEQMHFFVY